MIKKIITFIIVIFSQYSFAQSNQTVFEDSNFNAGGTGFWYENPNFYEEASPVEILIQADSKIIVGGKFTSYNGSLAKGIIRLNEDGSIDETFTAGTGFNGTVFSMIFFTPETILAAGSFTQYNGVACNNMVLLNLDGTINSINIAGTNNKVLKLLQQPDGKILFSGEFTAYNNLQCNHVGRLNTDGTLDTDFNVVISDISWSSLALQQDGKIIVGGSTLYRLNQDGSHDVSFNENIEHNLSISTIYVDDASSKIYIAGSSYIYISNPVFGSNTINLFKLNNDGSLDESFNLYKYTYGNHTYYAPYFYAMVPYQNNLLISGYFGGTGDCGYTQVIDKNGYINQSFKYCDTTDKFDINYFSSHAITDFKLTNDNQMIAVGNFDSGIMKLTLPTLDTNTPEVVSKAFFYSNNHDLVLSSPDKIIKTVDIFDVNGRNIFKKSDVFSNQIDINIKTSGVYYAVILFSDNSVQQMKCLKL